MAEEKDELEGGAGGAGGEGGEGGEGGAGGEANKPGEPGKAGSPGERGERGAQGNQGNQGPKGSFAFSKPQLAAFLVVVIAMVIGVARIEQVDNSQQEDAKLSRAAIVQSGDAIAVSGCNRDFELTKVLREEVLRGEKSTIKFFEEGTINAVQRDRSLEAAERLLRRYNLPDCRKADDILTDDPDKPVVVPKARYPGDGQ